MPGPRSLLVRLGLVLSLFTPIEALDRRVQQAVQDARRPAFEAPMRLMTDIGKGEVVLGGLLVIALFSGPAGPGTARAALGTLAPVNAVVEALKWTVNRPRPDGERRRANSSFPSSHAANAAALALVLGRRWRRLAPALWPLALAVGGSRIYLNRHFLSDVVSGVAIGVGLGWLAYRWLRSRGWTWEGRARGRADRIGGDSRLC